MKERYVKTFSVAGKLLTEREQTIEIIIREKECPVCYHIVEIGLCSHCGSIVK